MNRRPTSLGHLSRVLCAMLALVCAPASLPDAALVSASTQTGAPATPAVSDPAVPERLRSTIASTLKIDAQKVTATASFVKDLGADELALVELVMAYERTFKVAIPNADADKFVQVRDVVAYLRKRAVLK